MVRNVYLVVDKGREEKVIGFLERAFTDIHYVEKQINTGDYLICENVGGTAKILACIERKSHADFAASISDGRYANRAKMIELRRKTGCQLYWLMEGPAFPAPGRRFGSKGSAKPYSTLHTAELHLMVRDGIAILKTLNEPATAQELYDLCVAFRGLETVWGGEPTGAPEQGDADAPELGGADAPVRGDAGAPELGAPELGVPEMVTGRLESSDAVLATQMWAKLRGVSVVVAEKFIREFSVRDLLGGNPSFKDIGEMKSPTGRAITKDAKASLRSLQRGDPERSLKIVGGIPGLSKATAGQILEKVGGIKALCDMDADVLSEIKLQQKEREARIGKIKAAKILFFLNYCEKNAGVDGNADSNADGNADSSTTDIV